MSPKVFSLILLAAFAVLTFGLSIIGMRKTTSLKSFAIGKGDMSPVLVGLTMAASIASTATFVINPGFVYEHGLAAYAHFGLGAMGGLICALLVLSRWFQRVGQQVSAVTLPDWLRKRFDSKPLGVAFAAMTLLYITFVVLLLAASALILVAQFDELSYHWALVCVLVFVFGYVLLGGSYAHAYTNAFQGGMMLIIAVIVFAVGAGDLFGSSPAVEGGVAGGFFAKLEAVSPAYAAWFNPESKLYYDFFSVFGSSFIITFALMLQPHILTKVLYLGKDEKALRTFLVVTIAASLLFSLILFVGFYAKISGIPISHPQKVVLEYLPTVFSPLVVTFVLVSLLAAGMSTLDGILVSISAVVVQDLFLAFGEQSEARTKQGLALSRIVLVVVGLISLALAWNPPASLGLFAQQGVYALVAASAAPLLVGIFAPAYRNGTVVLVLAGAAIGIHAVVQLVFDVANPSVSAGLAIVITVAAGFGIALLSTRER